MPTKGDMLMKLTAIFWLLKIHPIPNPKIPHRMIDPRKMPRAVKRDLITNIVGALSRIVFESKGWTGWKNQTSQLMSPTSIRIPIPMTTYSAPNILAV